MAEVVISETGLDELIAKFDGAEQIVYQEMDRTMRASLNVFKQEVVPITPVFLGHLKASIAAQVFGSPASDTFVGVLSTAIAYGEEVENGRPPGKYTPIAPLEYWTRRQLGLPYPKSLSRAIQISIKHKKEGKKGFHMFERGFKRGLQRVEQLWQTMGARIAERLD